MAKAASAGGKPNGGLPQFLPCVPQAALHEPRTVRFGPSGATVDPERVNQVRNGRPNLVSTVRFTPLTWLPKSLFCQFKRAANIYFLIVSCLSCFDFSPYSWTVVFLPFAAVLLFSSIKDAYEDLRRRRDDWAENNRDCCRFDVQRRCFVAAKWSSIYCGDVIFTMHDETFSADLLLIYASGGPAFISTANLDGETNLKERRAPSLCVGLTQKLALPPPSTEAVDDAAFARQHAQVIADAVLAQGLEASLDAAMVGLADVSGYLQLVAVNAQAADLSPLKECSINYEHLLPRGCVLRNTPWTVAVVAYAGDDTKTRLNVMQTKGKFSNMQKLMNRCIQGIVVCEFIWCFFAAVVSASNGNAQNPFITFLVYWLVIYHVLPISLYVCFEMVKMVLGYWINTDPQMCHEGQFAVARTVDLVEELGQVDFVFSDKTGTLTENEMRFARCCIAGQDLGEFRRAVGSKLGDSGAADPEGVLNAQKMFQDIRPDGGAGSAVCGGAGECDNGTVAQDVRWLFMCLVLCSTVQVKHGCISEPTFLGSSPDEVALVIAAHRVGVSLIERVWCDNAWKIKLQTPPRATEHVFTIRQEIEFTSDRKRMSVVCESSSGELFCITKGADTIVSELCTDGRVGDADWKYVQDYAVQGLRTLVLASRTLDRPFFERWHAEYEAARAGDIKGRDEREAKVVSKMETYMRFVGVTAVEDRLQQGVPEAIRTIKAGGIRFWVLTGDKVETAVEVARSCGLFLDGMALAFVKGATSQEHTFEMVLAASETLAGNPTVDSGIVLDGSTLEYILKDEATQKMFYDLAIQAKACVCCRLSPRQKRRLIELVREQSPSTITLAIGDGANDVSMIQGAQVGIGIRGKEGSQAVQACDIAISQFRFLVPLLFCHGRRAYRRIAVFLCWYVYKHLALIMGDLIWGVQSGFKGDRAYPEWLSASYTVIFTSLSVICTVAFDKDVSDEVAMMHPELYVDGPSRAQFNAKVFSGWMFCGVWHGSLAWLLPNILLGNQDPESKRFWVSACTSFSLVVYIVSLRLLLVTLTRANLATSLSFLSAAVGFLAVFFGLGQLPAGIAMQPNMEGLPAQMVTDGTVLAVFFLTPIPALAVDVVYLLVRRSLAPTALERLWSQLRSCSVAPA